MNASTLDCDVGRGHHGSARLEQLLNEWTGLVADLPRRQACMLHACVRRKGVSEFGSLLTNDLRARAHRLTTHAVWLVGLVDWLVCGLGWVGSVLGFVVGLFVAFVCLFVCFC